MKQSLRKKCIIVVVWVGFCLTVHAQLAVTIDAGLRGARIGNRHNGLFFEEINHSGEGGLYAEMIRNRSFQDNTTYPVNWSVVGDASQSISGTHPLNDVNTLSNKVVMNTAFSGIKNGGWWGCYFQKDKTYDLSFWVRSDHLYVGNIEAQLQDSKGNVIGQGVISGPFGSQWQKVSLKIVATATYTQGSLALLGTETGTLYYDCVSLFPPTFKGRVNGCRQDIAQLLADCKPGVLRFPGGCVVEGAWKNGKTNRFEWKNTIGPIEQRPGHYNANWGYPVSDGFGFDEMLTLAEDLGAEPLFVVNIGLGHEWIDPNVEDYIQEALDAIEYCNGDASTRWGKERIKNGHAEPYNLRMIEIGNENYGHSDYAERYRMFYDAIHSRYPEMEIIGDDAWTWEVSCPVDIVDQHHYADPKWFREHYGFYDNYCRADHKVYVGEYAVTSSMGVNGNLDAALAESVFMMGMERNSDVVVMNSYAPMLTHERDYNWKPDMIRFDNHVCYGTPSYYVQRMMSSNRGRENVQFQITSNKNPKHDFISCSITDDEKKMYIKVVNDGDTPCDATFTIENAIFSGGDVEVLTSDNLTDENNIGNPFRVKPFTDNVISNSHECSYSLPAYSLCIFRMDIDEVNVPEVVDEPLPSPIVSYSFENSDFLSDDINSHSFAYQLHNTGSGGASLVTMDDGNTVFYSGQSGYMSMDEQMAKYAFGRIMEDYTISIDVFTTDISYSEKYSWAYCFNHGTSSYVGMVCQPNNTNWYYELLQNSKSNRINTGGGFAPGKWHNITLTYREGEAILYVDGYPEGSGSLSVHPADMASSISSIYLAKSAFSWDAIMPNTYFDDFRIYDTYLTRNQVCQLAETTIKKSTSCTELSNIHLFQIPQNLHETSYRIDGTPNRGNRGIIIKNGMKKIQR